MIKQLGIMLCKEREKMGETQKSVAEGIISISELCRVERGEQEIDYFTLQALFERLGKSIDKLELAVSDGEYEAVAYRIEIERSIKKWDSEMLVDLISGYYACNDDGRSIHRQYRQIMGAMARYMQDGDYASCQRCMEQALAYTQREDWAQMLRCGQRLCNQEIRIILVIAYCRWRLGNMDGLAEKLEILDAYIRHHYTDTEERVKVYPHCAWLLGMLYLDQGRVAEAYAVCRKGRESLLQNGSLIPLRQILELEEACLQRMGRPEEPVRCRRYQEAVAFLYEAAGVCPESDMIAVFMQSSFQGEFIITNELVRDIREAKGISQEQLCENICSQETLSRIESGKRRPNKRKLYLLLKKMGMERENYYGFIETDDYELYEKVRQYNRSFPKGRREEAARLLNEIEDGIDMTKTVNRQFIGMERICEQRNQGKLSLEQANRQLWELLALTMPPINPDRMIYRAPFRTEYMIWNHMAANLRKAGRVEDAIGIYEELMQCYKKSRVSMRHHAVPGMTLYTNYTGYLEENDELEKAETVGKEGLNHSVECCRGDMAGDILANLSMVYGKRGLPNIEEKYLRHGYYLNDLYDRISGLYMLQRAYQEKFHKCID